MKVTPEMRKALSARIVATIKSSFLILLGPTGYFTRAMVVTATLLTLQAHTMLGSNRISLRKNADNTISVHLSNNDAVAGAHFSVNARGGVALQSFEGTERLAVAGISVFQFKKDESTVNVVLLAPVRSSMSAGEGVIGKISFVSGAATGSDSARVFLTNTVLCDVAAKELETTTAQLVWSLSNTASEPHTSFTLEPNYPNPFNPSTAISYQLSAFSFVTIGLHPRPRARDRKGKQEG